MGSEWVDAGGLLHDVPAPGSVWLVHAPDGRIWGLTSRTNKLVWSTDGGRTWSQRPLPRVPAGGSEAYEVVPTAVPGEMVLARGAAQTVFSPKTVLLFGSTGKLLQRNHLSLGNAAMDSAAVTPDGSLVMELYAEPNGDSGIFRATAGNWTDLRKVMRLPTAADGRPAAAMWMGSSLDPSGQPVMWAVFRSGELATSTDDGQTWTTQSIR